MGERQARDWGEGGEVRETGTADDGDVNGSCIGDVRYLGIGGAKEVGTKSIH